MDKKAVKAANSYGTARLRKEKGTTKNRSQRTPGSRKVTYIAWRVAEAKWLIAMPRETFSTSRSIAM